MRRYRYKMLPKERPGDSMYAGLSHCLEINPFWKWYLFWQLQIFLNKPLPRGVAVLFVFRMECVLTRPRFRENGRSLSGVSTDRYPHPTCLTNRHPPNLSHSGLHPTPNLSRYQPIPSTVWRWRHPRRQRSLYRDSWYIVDMLSWFNNSKCKQKTFV